jgi:TetR/AcrR family transcriptional regulator, cholesterol catabolism regulator
MARTTISTPAETPADGSRLQGRRSAAKKRGLEGYNSKRSELVSIASKMFHERGFYNTSLSEIVTSAGLDRSTAYYYVSSKEELYLEVVHEELASVAGAASAIRAGSGTATERLYNLFVLLTSKFDEHYPDLYLAVLPGINRLLTEADGHAEEIALRMAAVGRSRRKIYDAFHDVIVDGLQSHEFHSPLAPAILSNCLIQMISSSQAWYQPDGAFSSSEIGTYLAELILGGLLMDQGRQRWVSSKPAKKPRRQPKVQH